MDYLQKYLKYKNKYLSFKKQMHNGSISLIQSGRGLEELQATAEQIFNSIIEPNSEQLTSALTEMISKYLELRMSVSGLVMDKPIDRMVSILLSLNPLLVSPFRTRVIEKNGSGKESKMEERMQETTFKDIFLTDIKSQDWHKHKVKGVEYSCDFHQESLFSHLIMAMVSSVWYLLLTNPEETDEYARFIGALALLHDIGKPGAMRTGSTMVKDVNKYVTKFATHGLIGGIILQKAYSENFRFNLEEWDILCRCTSVHMCGYHSTDDTKAITQAKWFRLSLERPPVKKGLLYLSVGDSIGNVRIEDLNNDENLFKSRESFVKTLETKIADPTKIFTKLNTTGLVIVLIGGSAAGKTTLAREIIEYLTSRDIRCTYVSRDDIMLETISPILSLPNDQSSYAECYKYIKTPSNSEDMKNIDVQVKLRISNSIAFGEVCIIDTLASMYRKQFNSYFSDEVLNREILQITVDRNIVHGEADADRLGLDLDKQIELSGLTNLMNPLAKIDPQNVAQLSSVMESTNLKRDSGNRAQCTLTTSIVWTPEYTFGHADVFQLLGELEPGLTKGIVARRDTDSMNIVEYVNYLYGLYECDEELPIATKYNLKLDAIIRRFSVILFVVSIPFQLQDTEYKSRIFSIKYREGINKSWRPVWARHCRAIFFYVRDDFTCVPIKYQLQRGAELMTGMLVDAKIASTQDISNIKRIKILSDSQQKTCMLLLNSKKEDVEESKLDAHLTEKVDGSLLTITFYYGELAELMTNLVTRYGDEFSKMILAGFKKINADIVGVVSTQGTLMIGNDMQDYFVTSNLESSIVGLTRESIFSQAKTNTPTQMFKVNGNPWFVEMVRILGELPLPESPSSPVSNISLCCESVCANRLTAWGRLHTELAVSYTSSMCLFLGASWCGADWVVNVPHTMLNIKSVNEPRYWITTTAKQVDNLMTGLEDVVYGRITSLGFLTTFPPSNKTWDSSLPLHPEGYVCYTKEGEMFGLPIVDYNKLKLAAYYIGHKFHDESINGLYELSKTASNIFPMAKIVGDFYSGINTKFICIARELSKEFSSSSENQFVAELEAKSLKNKDKKMAGYQSGSPETKAKMIINGDLVSFNTWLKDVIIKYFPTIANTKMEPSDVKSGLIRMCMDLKPWLNYSLNSLPEEYEKIQKNPINFPGIKFILSMMMNQKDKKDDKPELLPC